VAARVAIEGVLREGLGVAQRFTGLPWVRAQFARKLGLDLYPGTVNLQVADPTAQALLGQLREGRGVDPASGLVLAGVAIDPPEPGYCVGWAYPARLGALPAAVIVPRVADYPADKLELVAAVRVRDALGLAPGDRVRVELLAAATG
jgi:CTP-dependent riboflavin kinase